MYQSEYTSPLFDKQFLNRSAYPYSHDIQLKFLFLGQVAHGTFIIHF